MAFINWDSSYSVDIKSIDAQHRTLFRMINEFAEAFEQEASREDIGLMLEELVNYTVIHFAKEEKLFRMLGYEQQDGHEKLHENLLNTVGTLKRKFDNGENILGEDTLQFLKSWLMQHIKGEDRKYAECFHRGGLY